MGACNFQDDLEEIIPSKGELHQEKVILESEAWKLSQQRFKSRDDLLNSVRNFAFMQGYAIFIKDSKRDRYVVMKCDRGGSYYNRWKLSDETRKRKTASRLINCPFEISGKKQVDGSWMVEVVNDLHNHEPSIDMSGHPSSRHFSVEEVIRIKEMVKAGIPTSQILSSLRQSNPKLLTTSQSVHNMKVKIFKEFLGRRTMLQALLEEFGKCGFTYNAEHDGDGHVTHLFFAHPISIALTKSYPCVFLMDCTYKTNQYKIPLLEVVGVSSFNTTFYSCFAFIEKERETDYIWALKMFAKILDVNQPFVIITDRELALMNAIQVVFPNATNLLCAWHIQKNIVARCKSHFKENEDWDGFLCDWISLVNFASELEFQQAFQNFEAQYKEKVFVLDYIIKTWIPYKELYIKAWTERHMHFGNHVTSRVDGAHSTIKTYLQSSAGNLYGVRDKISLAIVNQFQEIRMQLEREKIRILHRFHIHFFKELLTHVSTFALDEILKQYELATSKTELFACKGHFMATMGLSCAHKIKKKMKYKVVQLEDIHSQWRIDTKSFVKGDNDQTCDDTHLSKLFEELKQRYDEWPIDRREAALQQISHLVNAPDPFLYEPKIDSHKGRPSNSERRKETNSTKRDPSAFEFVEKARKCGLCKGFGHNSRTCHLKAASSDS